MPIELQVIRASEFIRVSAKKLLNLEASKEALRVLAVACWKRGLSHALLDLRAVPVPEKPWFKPSELAALVDVFREAGFTTQQRLAILYRTDRYGGTRMFAFISQCKGLQVRAFGEFESALLWLSEERGAKSAFRGASIPIRFTEVKRGSTSATGRQADKGHRP